MIDEATWRRLESVVNERVLTDAMRHLKEWDVRPKTWTTTGSTDDQPRRFSQRRIDMAEAIATIRTTRAAIHAALLAEIGDEATADRLMTVVMRAIEGER